MARNNRRRQHDRWCSCHPALLCLAAASGGGLVERGLGGLPALAPVLAPEGLAVGQDGVDLPPLAAGGALDPELVLPGLAAGGVTLLVRSQADFGQASLLGVDGIGAVDSTPRWFRVLPHDQRVCAGQTLLAASSLVVAAGVRCRLRSDRFAL
jgi:hypothetical protein